MAYRSNNNLPSIVFVVLHYQTIQETIACVESILKLNQEVSVNTVIVVDNASPNGSGVSLKEEFACNERVEVLLNTENCGFAKGNNVGFRLAKSNSADFIALVNNDIVIDDEFFSKEVIRLYEEDSYGVLGPDIYSVKDGVHQNPMKGFALNKWGVRKRIVRSYAVRAVNKIGFLRGALTKNPNRIFDIDSSKKMVIDSPNDCVLQGSCLIFSPVYIDSFDGLYDQTFMYCEENILAYRCAIGGIKMLYSPSLKVNHYRGVATKASNGRIAEMVDFKHSQIINSLKSFEKLL